MALPIKDQLRYWGIASAITVLVLWFLGDVILPFVLGAALAYFLDPVADKLETWGFGRLLAVIIISLVALLLFVIAAILLIPSLINQAALLAETVPKLISNLQAWLAERFPDMGDENSTVRQSLSQIADVVQERGGDVLNRLFSSALGLINVVVLSFLVPVVTFYLLLDWDRITARVDDLLPRDHAPVIRGIAGDINRVLSSFIRGQGTVCLIMACFYSITLLAVGLNSGLVVGFLAGLISFIPYVGALVGGVLAIGLAIFQFWGEWWWIGAVVAIFFMGQFLEGNFLTPNLVGGSVGLHPVWLIFALSVFGLLFGFVGMLVAVPVAAAIGVLARFLIAEYRKSLLYLGQEGNPPPQDPDAD